MSRLVERHLFGPGPSNPYPEATSALVNTAPTAMIASLHAGLGRILDEGLEQVWARHEEAGRILQDDLDQVG